MDMLLITAAGVVSSLGSKIDRIGQVPECLFMLILASALSLIAMRLREFGNDNLVYARYRQSGINIYS